MRLALPTDPKCSDCWAIAYWMMINQSTYNKLRDFIWMKRRKPSKKELSKYTTVCLYSCKKHDTGQ